MTAAPGRPLDPAVTEAIQRAALRLLAGQGFVRMSMEGIAREAGVGQPAIYRRFRDKAEVVTTAITRALPPMPSPGEGTARERLWTVYRDGMPPDAEDYLALIGGLMAEHRHHPELIEAFRTRFLLPRRAYVVELLAAAQASGELRDDLEPERLLDLLAGPIWRGRSPAPTPAPRGARPRSPIGGRWSRRARRRRAGCGSASASARARRAGSRTAGAA